MGDVTMSRNGYIEDLEHQLAETRKHHQQTLGSLFDEQQAHGVTQGKLTECELELARLKQWQAEQMFVESVWKRVKSTGGLSNPFPIHPNEHF